MQYLILFSTLLLLSYGFFKIKKSTDKPAVPKTNETHTISDADTDVEVPKYPYEKTFLLTKTEYIFYRVLKVECDKRDFLICPKVRMEDFLKVTEKDYKSRLKYRGYIKSRHIDFLICDKNLYLLAGIELDDSSHNREEAQRVDNFKNNVFQTIQIPLYRIPTSRKGYQQQIQRVLDELVDMQQ